MHYIDFKAFKSLSRWVSNINDYNCHKPRQSWPFEIIVYFKVHVHIGMFGSHICWHLNFGSINSSPSEISVHKRSLIPQYLLGWFLQFIFV